MSRREKRKLDEYINAPSVHAGEGVDGGDDDAGQNLDIRLPKTPSEWEKHPRLIVVLEGAMLETVKIGESYELLNPDDHMNILRRYKRDLADVRPDITHQCLLMLLDSPLNKAGKLQVYIHTAKNVLIEVNPQLRLPRTFKRFCGLMVQLLKDLKIRATNGSGSLLKVIKNPVTDYFPIKCTRIGTSFQSPLLVDIAEYGCKAVERDPERTYAFAIGAIARGDTQADWVEEKISYSQFPLSAALACAKLTDAYERAWGIL